MRAGDVKLSHKQAATYTVGGQDVYLYTVGADDAPIDQLNFADRVGALGTFAQTT